MEELMKHLHKIRVPQKHDKIYNDECVYSFDTPDSPTGLYVNLTTFLGLGQDHLERYYQLTENPVFLHIKRRRKEIQSEHQGDGPEKKITRLAIGKADGFTPDQQKYTYHESYEIVILPNFTTIPYPSDNLPQEVEHAIKIILEAESATKIAEIERLSEAWDGEIKAVSKHASNLKQLDNGKKVPPSGWKCEKCDLTQNLWLNLSDGSILCGRKFYDGTGGNDHAVEHYSTTGYPLAVKLGTITKEGKADVFSYDEDDMVDDPHLIQHLSHWGINITQMEKTDKSMIELELDLNQRFGEWVALQEAASKLTPLYGPGYTGLANLGNSCYLNSVMQMLFVIPDFVKRFVDGASQIFQQSYTDPANDFNVQMAKLGIGLLSGRYSMPPNNENESRQGIPPRMFKTLVGRGHPGFSSNRQQDAQEFILHLINVIDRHSRHQTNPSDCFKFKVEERYQCSHSKKVKYTYRPEYLLPLPISLESAINKKQVAAYEALKKETEAKGQKLDSNTVVRPRIEFLSCLRAFVQSETVEQFYSSALNEKTTAQKTTRLASFPDYLLIHLKKFTVKEDWTPVKLDVVVEMPELLDLSILRGHGLQSTEELLPETTGSETPPPVYDSVVLNQLTDMGFPPEACKRALYFTENRGIEAATNWLMEHIADSDFADPFLPPGIDAKPRKDKFMANEDAVAMVIWMGFTREQAIKALKATDNNLERAADWIFSHQAELDALDVDDEQAHSEEIFRDGSDQYKLVGFMSHMGTSTMVGHYVCHLLKDDRWVIFNDDKVALSENPPLNLGYIYLYKRMD
ncbi:PREDICTED: ubiquitin carboxyl-terminal hydrolase 5 [Dufourea novaeangliae]|uniref:Ubiquitin carboxyl-terminal hydrolase n=1 Tax=Dufourea novaeangliae TaxID=178035 RepID=A0A154P5H2_DUFNO|nr:PREDICTED: ubiquitin carboxyl-terminal hydrolase 5 [Dufourea novaeangliae]KZC06438.1 Ubiquitin carboxyl-terminal hydrolase 5 [Dufourea novaeangliae]